MTTALPPANPHAHPVIEDNEGSHAAWLESAMTWLSTKNTCRDLNEKGEAYVWKNYLRHAATVAWLGHGNTTIFEGMGEKAREFVIFAVARYADDCVRNGSDVNTETAHQCLAHYLTTVTDKSSEALRRVANAVQNDLLNASLILGVRVVKIDSVSATVSFGRPKTT